MQRSVVVQHHPGRRARFVALIAVSAILLFALGAVLGRYGSLGLYERLLGDNQLLRQQLNEQGLALDQSRQSQENQQTRLDVAEQALAMVRRELAEQHAQIDELEQGVRFYRSLMAPGEQPEGLSVRSIELVPLAESRRYRYRLLVQQNARRHSLLTGNLLLEVIGSENGEAKSYQLATLSDQVDSQGIALRFKYFQAIEGELQLPEGFSPAKVVAYAKAKKPKQVEVRKDFPWLVQEKMTHVGS